MGNQKKTITNYEAIKNMSIEEMAVVFYMFAKPMMDGFGIPKENREGLKRSIMAFLKNEVGAKNEDRRSEEKS